VPNPIPSTASPIVSPAQDEFGYRSALSRFATGVAVVTACDAQGNPVGLTVSSFSPVSLHPPLILWSLGVHSSLLPLFQQASCYAVNVLRENQLDLCLQFAQRGVDRFAGVAWQPGACGTPLLANALAWFECKNRSQYTEGDHMIFVGEVQDYSYAEGSPLILHSRGYHVSQPHPQAPQKASQPASKQSSKK